MTNPWLIVPLVVPAMTAALLVLVMRRSLFSQRIVSVAATAIQLVVVIGFYIVAGDGEPRIYLLGNWPAPFGIVLVLDRLAATMLLLAGLLAFGVVLAAIDEWDKRGRHFHALFQFQLLGINGAFLTGDLFNLFVFFEVLLIASYGLMLHGGGAHRMKAGFHYIAINLIGSTVFLFAVGTIYSVTGTLNMADLAEKVPQVATGNQALLTAGALLLLTVFSIKSAMVPLHWWLPPAYGSTSPPAAALFAIMSKVGIYSIIRVYTLIFGAGAGPLADVATPWVLPAGILTLALGTIGVLASRRVLDLVCYSLIASMGTLLIAVGLGSAGLAAALYYAVQSTVASAGLFLLGGLLAPEKGSRAAFAWFPQYANVFAGFFFLLAIATIGMPPLAGFFGKLLILDAAREAFIAATVWPAILITSLLLILGFARTGMQIFWNRSPATETSTPRAVPIMPIFVIGAMIATVTALSVFAGPVMADMTATAEQLLSPHRYIAAVLRPIAAANHTGE
ncbi:monovalent cation/H+ antiporter subunit D [Bradyrhizobium roseum]|uniref:monovalent cation/H+ antiporter subunit D n=1 Tax=Bradyrhizobium roseum TaxID=3056648 RepID=UPI002616B3CA|nr:monovalent cation/H+ antiporter subunit D [Bradyrhizobium roseus]WKA30404.1 monovalent cation/H+ antiporter subunit D [Bradyrhizobium roseus]